MVTGLLGFLLGVASALVALAVLGKRWSRQRDGLLNVPVKFVEARAIRAAATGLERAHKTEGRLSPDRHFAMEVCAETLRGVARDLARDAVDEASPDQMANMARVEEVDLDAITPTLTGGADRAE